MKKLVVICDACGVENQPWFRVWVSGEGVLCLYDLCRSCGDERLPAIWGNSPPAAKKHDV